MTMVSITYILQAKEGFQLNLTASNIISLIVTAVCIVMFNVKMKGNKESKNASENLQTNKIVN